MPNTCTICPHPRREEIDRQLVLRTPYRQVAEAFNVSPNAVYRHLRGHLPETLAQARETADLARGEDLLAEVRDLHARTLEGLDAAEQVGDLRAMMTAVRETRRNLEFLARLLGRIEERPRVSLLELPEWDRLREALFEALRPYPEVRIAVAERLAALSSGT